MTCPLKEAGLNRVDAEQRDVAAVCLSCSSEKCIHDGQKDHHHRRKKRRLDK